jgi:hypothetical protein
MEEVASGRAESVGPLYRRYAPAIFRDGGAGARPAGRPGDRSGRLPRNLAHAAKFDPKRGPFRLALSDRPLPRRQRAAAPEPTAANRGRPQGERLARLRSVSRSLEESWFAYRKRCCALAVEPCRRGSAGRSAPRSSGASTTDRGRFEPSPRHRQIADRAGCDLAFCCRRPAAAARSLSSPPPACSCRLAGARSATSGPSPCSPPATRSRFTCRPPPECRRTRQLSIP